MRFLTKKILHIDMDAFFASVEQRDFPEFRGKPVVVGGNPRGRGVVAAASYEARKYGIHSAMPAAQAVRLCPHVIFLTPRFDVYRLISLQIREILYEYTPLVEPLSLDEAYLDITGTRQSTLPAPLIAREIKKRIKQETGLTASAGVAPNKFLAKIASDMDKPDGLFVIPPEKALLFLEELKIEKFHGVGKATKRKMESLGIENGKDLRDRDVVELVKKFGKAGYHYYRIVRGLDNREVKPDRIRKSIGKEQTFTEDMSDPEEIRTFLTELADKVASSLRRHDAAGKTVTLKARYKNFETVTRSATMKHFVQDPGEIARIATGLLDQTEAGKRKVRLLGITLSSLNLDEFRLGEQLEISFSGRVPAGSAGNE
ncbi:MAG: DNA polymerase IV [Balneolaceae bacterium]